MQPKGSLDQNMQKCPNEYCSGNVGYGHIDIDIDISIPRVTVRMRRKDHPPWFKWKAEKLSTNNRPCTKNVKPQQTSISHKNEQQRQNNLESKQEEYKVCKSLKSWKQQALLREPLTEVPAPTDYYQSQRLCYDNSLKCAEALNDYFHSQFCIVETLQTSHFFSQTSDLSRSSLTGSRN